MLGIKKVDENSKTKSPCQKLKTSLKQAKYYFPQLTIIFCIFSRILTIQRRPIPRLITTSNQPQTPVTLVRNLRSIIAMIGRMIRYLQARLRFASGWKLHGRNHIGLLVQLPELRLIGRRGRKVADQRLRTATLMGLFTGG